MKISVVTGSRADFGLLSPVMRHIQNSSNTELQTIVTGSHLSPVFGSTAREITAAGFEIDWTLPQMNSADTGRDVALQIGAGIPASIEALEALAPDAVVLLGDRYELLATAIACFFLGIPIVHLHGGEVTYGAFDDAVRHIVSRLAHVHAVAAPEYGERLVRAGEDPNSVHVVGGLGVDLVSTIDRMSLEQIQAQLQIEVLAPLLLVTYHPVTGVSHDTEDEVSNLISALGAFPEATVIFTVSNGDPEHALIMEATENAVCANANWHMFRSLGSPLYLSLMAHASAVVGNSSSGLLEAPALGVPSVNIGPRQEGRLQAQNVISCASDRDSIVDAIKLALAAPTGEPSATEQNPYGVPGAAAKIADLIGSIEFDNLPPKRYFDGLGREESAVGP